MMRTGQELTRTMMADADAEETERSIFFRVFMYWVKHCGEYADYDPGDILRLWLRNPTDEEIQAYSAPFPSEEYL